MQRLIKRNTVIKYEIETERWERANRKKNFVLWTIVLLSFVSFVRCMKLLCWVIQTEGLQNEHKVAHCLLSTMILPRIWSNIWATPVIMCTARYTPAYLHEPITIFHHENSVNCEIGWLYCVHFQKAIRLWFFSWTIKGLNYRHKNDAT